MSANLNVLAQARWPEPTDRAVPPIPGFVLSTFNPMVAAVADRCLRRHYRESPAPGGEGRTTAVILVSASGDMASANHVARTVDTGGRPGPLFFYQSVPNGIAGHVAARWALGGPVVCLCPTGDPMTDGLAEAALLIEDGDADAALVVLVEQFGAEGESAAAAAVLVSGGAKQ